MAEEKNIERKLHSEIKKRGGLALKLVSPGFTGVPDRLVLLPAGTIYFVELKAAKGVVLPRQRVVHGALRALGFSVKTVMSKEQLEEFLDEL